MSLLTSKRKALHAELLSSLLTTDSKGIPNIADSSSKTSIEISRGMVELMGLSTKASRAAGQTSGNNFEALIADHMKATFGQMQHIRPGTWVILPDGSEKPKAIYDYVQYEHISVLNEILREHPALRASLGAEYLIKPDVVVLRKPEPDETLNATAKLVDNESCRLTSLRLSNYSDADHAWILHASISCKWTLRSDRAQNARSEALNLIRSRKGRVPNICAVTAEPLPMRLASLAMGSSDLDCVYHIALPELAKSVEAFSSDGHAEQLETLQMLVDGKRLRDISDLPLDLAV